MNAPPPDYDGAVSTLRVPPHSIEAEQAVLGGLLLDNAGWDRAADVLAESDFYSFQHRLVYGAIGHLVNANRQADVITVGMRLQDIGKLDEVGGMGYLNQLTASTPSAHGIRSYALMAAFPAILCLCMLGISLVLRGPVHTEPEADVVPAS